MVVRDGVLRPQKIRARQAEPFVLQEYRLVADPLRDEDVRPGVAQARVRGLGRALTGVGLLVTYVVLGLLVHAGWVPLAVAGTAVIALRVATSALNRLVLAANQLIEQGRYVTDYLEFLAEAARAPVRSGGAVTDPDRIEVEHVGFTYPESRSRALRDASFTIERGQTIALVGENGSGKTTLAKLIAGLYAPPWRRENGWSPPVPARRGAWWAPRWAAGSAATAGCTA